MQSTEFWFLVAIAAIVWCYQMLRRRRRFRARAGWVGDASNQLRLVMKATFRTKPVLSKGEYRIFRNVETLLYDMKLGYRVVPQVPLGEIIDTDDRLAFRAINSKRVDMVVISKGGLALLAIEYQGPGHYTESAVARDAIKKEALRRAGVGYVEFFEDDPPNEIMRRCAAALNGRPYSYAGSLPGDVQQLPSR